MTDTVDFGEYDGDFGENFAERLFFRTPLYSDSPITDAQVKQLFVEDLKLDGYCPSCGEKRTFRRSFSSMKASDYQSFAVDSEIRNDDLALRCTRYDHRILFHCRIDKGRIQKIGQYPSFADIAIDESKSYSRLLSKSDAAEFHKALGLAAHDVGIGSYVYLRRIFERLIQKRFDEFKTSENWSDEDFKKLRMAERIEFLQGHLPSFLVRNAKLYSILSVGVHELDEKQCLAFFDVLKQSTIVILEEDRLKKEEIERQKKLEKQIAAFSRSSITGDASA
jgi:hypothetical protein